MLMVVRSWLSDYTRTKVAGIGVVVLTTVLLAWNLWSILVVQRGFDAVDMLSVVFLLASAMTGAVIVFAAIQKTFLARLGRWLDGFGTFTTEIRWPLDRRSLKAVGERMVALYPEDTAWFLYTLVPGYMLKNHTPGFQRGQFWRVSSQDPSEIEEQVDGYIRDQLNRLDPMPAGEGADEGGIEFLDGKEGETAVLLARIEEIALGLAVQLPPEGAWRKQQRLQYTRKAFNQTIQRLRLIQIEWDKFQTLIDDEELGMVVRMLAHEIAGTLTLVVNSESMEERVEKALARSKHLVSQLQEVPSLRSGIFAVDPGSVPLSKMIDDVVRNVRGVWNDKAFMVGWGVEEDVEVVGDENLYSVLQNVVFNALSFARDKVVIDVAPGEREEHVLIKVTDDGPGVPLEDKEWIFKPMVAKGTEYRPRGKGVGLFIARTIAREVSGDVYLAPPTNGKDRSNQFVIQLTANRE